MEKKKSIMQTLKDLNVGEELTFHAGLTRTIRNYCSMLNAEFYTSGKRWACSLKREQSVIIAGRIK